MPLTILLRCHDLEVTTQFYRSVLGFNMRYSAAGTPPVERHGATLIFLSRDLWKTAIGLSATVYFTVPDADDYFTSVKDKVTVAWPLQDMSYGSREFGIKDCNGYYLAFAQQT